jgi:hypothetical protein
MLVGRCIGIRAVAGHSPCRSGSPQAVLGGVQLDLIDDVADLAAGVTLAEGAWASTGSDETAATKSGTKT